MGLFSRHSRDDSGPAGQSPGQPGQQHSRLSVPGLAEYAARQGWRPAGESPLSADAREFTHAAVRTMYGAPRSGIGVQEVRVTPTVYRDCYAGQVDGLEFVVANGWTSIIELRPVSVCQVRLGWFLSEPVWIEPTRYISMMGSARQMATGDLFLDRQFRVYCAHAQTATELLGPDVRPLLRARDDWFFSFGGTDLLCVCREGYRSPRELRARLAEVRGIARALPRPATISAAARPISLSGGVVFDPAHIEEWQTALASLPPGQQQQIKEELRARLAERRVQRPDRRHRG
jgi:hypothetical protein